ncbi:hypothetical protein [Alteromonas oceanisediminis]|uniref:hypothetical protein n=1 Tax=Alteromonas oceanisediminis TaxID=2836180 RepID=UPI001BD97F83|nr:hypothetical protein [Alteromonas oceanisediminis]MBT0588114.1 hypothetical protein [Alteromonas oceanisediminis]
MYFISCLIFIATIILGLWFGNSLPLFLDQTFPTILGLVIVPTMFFAISIHSFNSIKITIKAVKKSETNLLAQRVFHSCGNVGLLIGITVTLINFISIGYNWSDSPSAGYLSVAISTAIMSTFIGLVVKVLCLVGFYRVQGYEG